MATPTHEQMLKESSIYRIVYKTYGPRIGTNEAKHVALTFGPIPLETLISRYGLKAIPAGFNTIDLVNAIRST